MWLWIFSIAPIWKVFLNLISTKSIEQDLHEHLSLYKTNPPSSLCALSFFSISCCLTHLQVSRLQYSHTRSLKLLCVYITFIYWLDFLMTCFILCSSKWTQCLPPRSSWIHLRRSGWNKHVVFFKNSPTTPYFTQSLETYLILPI